MRTALFIFLSVFAINSFADDLIDMPLPDVEIQELENSVDQSERVPSSIEKTQMTEVTAKDRKDMVIKTISRNFPELKNCYKQGLKKDAKMEGKVEMAWDLDAQGKVVAAAVDKSQLGNKEVEACLVKRFSEWYFPAQAKIKNSQGRMKYTFTFTPESVR